jgi:sulfate permease, SulP family
MGCSARRNWWLTVSAPGLGTLRGYRRAWLRGDLIAGVTVAAYLVPQVMAYAAWRGCRR